MLAYSAFAYRVFRGKTPETTGGTDEPAHPAPELVWRPLFGVRQCGHRRHLRDSRGAMARLLTHDQPRCSIGQAHTDWERLMADEQAGIPL